MTRMFAFLLAMVASVTAYAQAKQDFLLVNKTGYDISEVYVSTTKTNDWEEDVLGNQTLEDGETLTVNFRNAGKSCIFDLKVVYEEDDSAAYWRGIDLCKVSKVTIFYSAKADETRADFE